MQSPQTNMPGKQMPDSKQSTTQIKNMLRDVKDRCRQEANSVNNPKVEALLETTAEVVQGLMTAYEDYEKGQEKAWQ
jgi:hypothetical protein